MTPHGIVTPEAVVLDFEPAGVASRAMARIVDLVALIAIFSTLINIVVVVATGGNETGMLIGFLIMAFLALFAYPAVMETFAQGRTLGKMAIGLRVVTVEGGPVRMRHCAVRSMMQLIDILVTLGGAAVISAVLSPRGQRLGDSLAGTLVVRERRVSSFMAERAVRFPNPPGLDGLVHSIDPSPLGPDQAALVRGFLIRVTELEPAARASLASRIAPKVSETLGQPLPGNVHPEAWLACVAAALQRRSEQIAAERAPAPPPRPSPVSSLRSPPPPPAAATRASRSGTGESWVPPS